MNYFDHLIPNEILVLIFKFLSLKQTSQCRLVTKKWRFVIDNLVQNQSLSLFINYPKQTILLDLNQFYLSYEKALYYEDEVLFNYDLNQRFKKIKILYFVETYYVSFKYREEFENLISKF